MSAALDLAAREWLKAGEKDDTEKQRKLHAAVSKYVGTISGGDPTRSANVSALVREKLRKKYGR